LARKHPHFLAHLGPYYWLDLVPLPDWYPICPALSLPSYWLTFWPIHTPSQYIFSSSSTLNIHSYASRLGRWTWYKVPKRRLT
jgi:hypothetical protein